MLIIHLLAGLVLGFCAALWSWLEGYSLWAMLGLYVLVGNLGVLASAAVALIHFRGLMQPKPTGQPQGT